jgi:hypothetical protein
VSDQPHRDRPPVPGSEVVTAEEGSSDARSAHGETDVLGENQTAHRKEPAVGSGQWFADSSFETEGLRSAKHGCCCAVLCRTARYPFMLRIIVGWTIHEANMDAGAGRIESSRVTPLGDAP